MKVKIGKYRSDLIPIHNLGRQYEMWRSDSFYLDEEDYKWYDKIILGFFDKLEVLFRPINHWNQRRPRKVKVHVDYYDVWAMDHTLGILIAPMLKTLQKRQHGMPHVDNEDVPEELRFDPVNAEDWTEETDKMHQDRWDWVLNEMIWTFEQYAMNDDDDQFVHNVDQLEIIWTSVPDMPGANTMDLNHQKDPNRPAYWVDEEGRKAHHERKKNGLRLFAKYYDSLWD